MSTVAPGGGALAAPETLLNEDRDDGRNRLQVLRRLASNPLSLAGMVVLALFVIMAVAAPLIAPDDPTAFNGAAKFTAPGASHLLGTDDAGRDILSRIIYGSRYSLTAAVGILAFAATAGTAVGLVAGYVGGWVDEVLMRVTDMFLAFPALVLAMAAAAALGPSLFNAVVATAIVWWPWYARLVRGQVLQLKNEPFVAAARVAGARPGRIILRHVLRNCTTPIIVQMSLDVGYAILTMASLSFVGLGAQPPTPEWGSMISVGRDFYLNQWWYATFPGLAIFLVVMAANLVGDGLQEALAPRRAL
ncbi:MAG TPA: ABC transporter permease [Baekduia sp.]|nr:ABC transporter permease [Baekduia sp.]